MTTTPTPAAAATGLVCSPRPRVQVEVKPVGGDRLVVTVTATGAQNRLYEIRFVDTANAVIEMDGQTGSGSFSIPAPLSDQPLSFSVHRVQRGQPVTVPMVALDACGEWPTFVGGGAGAF